MYFIRVGEMKKEGLRMEHLCQFHKPESSNISFNSNILHKLFINVCFTSEVISICSFHSSATQTSKRSANLQPTAKVLFKKWKCLVDSHQNSRVEEEAVQPHGTSPVPACLPPPQTLYLLSDITAWEPLHSLIKQQVTKQQLL